jgi:MFS family permease
MDAKPVRRGPWWVVAQVLSSAGSAAVGAAGRVRAVRWPPLLVPLRTRNYRLLWAGVTVSWIGDNFQLVALPVLILDLTHRPAIVGTVLMAEALPRAALMVGGGVLIDRAGARRVMLLSSTLAGGVAAAAAALTAAGAIAVWHLYVFAAALGAASALLMPAGNTLLPEVLPAAQVRSGNALRSLAFQGARFVAPPLAGVAVALAGPAAAFGVNAASFFVAVLLLRLVRLAAPRAAPRTASALADLREGVRALRRDAPTWVIFVIVVIWSLGYGGATLVGMPVLAKLALAGGDPGVGVLFGALGVGALAGSIAVGAVPAVPRPGLAFSLGVIGSGIALALAGSAPALWVAAAWLAVSGVLFGICPIVGWTLVQTRAPAPVRGRIVALITLGITGLQPLSLALAGVAGDALGPRSLLVAGAAIAAVSGIYGLSQRALRDVEWT